MGDEIGKRRVRPLRVLLRHWGWVPLIPLVMAVGLFIGAGSLGSQAKLLESHGLIGEATVIGKQTVVRRDSDNNRSTTYYVTYSFDTRTESHERRDSVGRRFYDRVVAGQVIPVRYVEHDPSIAEIEIGATSRSAGWMRFAAGLVLMVGLGLAWVFWRRIGGIMRAALRGEVREARVTAHLDTNVRINRQPRYKLQWRDARGETGSGGLLPASALQALPLGSVIRVYADPKTGRTWWEEDL